MPGRLGWLFTLAAITALGLLSRTFHLGQPLWDKYLGDALYAAMVYVLLRLLTKANPLQVAMTSSAVMIVIEVFQLTGIPASLLTSPKIAVRILARLLGTHFSFFDLLAYAVGILCLGLIDHYSPISSRNSNAKDSI